jgi:hypothetical protein
MTLEGDANKAFLHKMVLLKQMTPPGIGHLFFYEE